MRSNSSGEIGRGRKWYAGPGKWMVVATSYLIEIA